jgi:protein-L-isoaspartate(D-aspartate) O-methyltransferase
MGTDRRPAKRVLPFAEDDCLQQCCRVTCVPGPKVAEQDDAGVARDRLTSLRHFYARFVASRGVAQDPRIEAAFAAIPREPFAGPGPWSIFAAGQWTRLGQGPGYVQTPDDDPAFLYQDVLIALDAKRGINIGEPSLHAHCLDALAPRVGETVLQVGVGSGYYTAILAHLVGAGGRVCGFEIDPDLAQRAERNLAPWPWASVHAQSGVVEGLPPADAIYVNAGVTQPSWAWLDALRPGGRLLFPLQEVGGLGGMLLVEKPKHGGLAWPARFVSRAAFIACETRQDEATGRGLSAAFEGGGWEIVRSLRLDNNPDATCWFDGGDWWLSTRGS